MKWRSKQVGDIRTKEYFAIIPRRCDDGYTYWLARLSEKQELVLCEEGWCWTTLSVYPVYNLNKKEEV